MSARGGRGAINLQPHSPLSRPYGRGFLRTTKEIRHYGTAQQEEQNVKNNWRAFRVTYKRSRLLMLVTRT